MQHTQCHTTPSARQALLTSSHGGKCCRPAHGAVQMCRQRWLPVAQCASKPVSRDTMTPCPGSHKRSDEPSTQSTTAGKAGWHVCMTASHVNESHWQHSDLANHKACIDDTQQMCDAHQPQSAIVGVTSLRAHQECQRELCSILPILLLDI